MVSVGWEVVLDSPSLEEGVDEDSLVSDLPVSAIIEDVSEAASSLGTTLLLSDMTAVKSWGVVSVLMCYECLDLDKGSMV